MTSATRTKDVEQYSCWQHRQKGHGPAPDGCRLAEHKRHLCAVQHRRRRAAGIALPAHALAPILGAVVGAAGAARVPLCVVDVALLRLSTPPAHAPAPKLGAVAATGAAHVPLCIVYGAQLRIPAHGPILSAVGAAAGAGEAQMSAPKASAALTCSGNTSVPACWLRLLHSARRLQTASFSPRSCRGWAGGSPLVAAHELCKGFEQRTALALAMLVSEVGGGLPWRGAALQGGCSHQQFIYYQASKALPQL